mmetsp:Transcript_26305/g.29516  ORF Transcript_26305/g.29516 Transcript_26305/m.29516 type:complete len:112 (+) Transcript_26305:261-596(+)|eukprot:CAMPEP_0171017384 /NCGR_PEP_ID=MMETSP0736-20130129/27393_1 /TAXON_ID=186038 /ORGANISM="Fragilariopsis kerguelensis, Strain L26-C5" /LENGTH=111 /DNA_ID=CAMNT_0011453195 /DNA_START=350 /DNA_END=685 /DNA_ORIENTATION=-
MGDDDDGVISSLIDRTYDAERAVRLNLCISSSLSSSPSLLMLGLSVAVIVVFLLTSMRREVYDVPNHCHSPLSAAALPLTEVLFAASLMAAANAALFIFTLIHARKIDTPL